MSEQDIWEWFGARLRWSLSLALRPSLLNIVMRQIQNSQDKKPAAQKTPLNICDTTDGVIGCTIAAKILARKDNKFGRTSTSDVLKMITVLRKQTANRKINDAKLLTIDLSPSWNKHVSVGLSLKTVQALDHFVRPSGALNDIISKCLSLVNGVAWEKTFATLQDDSKTEIQVDGPIKLHSVRLMIKSNWIRVW